MVAAIPPGLAPEAPRLSAAEQYRLRGLGGVRTATNTSIKWKMEDAPRPASPLPAARMTVAGHQRRKSLGDAVFGRRGAAPDAPATSTLKISSPIVTTPDASTCALSLSPITTSADQSRVRAIKRKPVPIFVDGASSFTIPPQTLSNPTFTRPTHRRGVHAETLDASEPEAADANDAADSAVAPLPSPSSDSSSSGVDSSSAGSPSTDSDDSFAFFEAAAGSVSTDDDEELDATPALAYSSRTEYPTSHDGNTSEDEKTGGVANYAPLKQSVFIERFSLDTIDRERALAELATVRDFNLEPRPQAAEPASQPAAARVTLESSTVDTSPDPQPEIRSHSSASGTYPTRSIQQRRLSLPNLLSIATRESSTPPRRACGSESDNFTSAGAVESVFWAPAAPPAPVDEEDLDSDAFEVALEAECASSISSPTWDGTFTGDTEESDREFHRARRTSIAELFPWSVPASPVDDGRRRASTSSAVPASRVFPGPPADARRASTPQHTYTRPRRPSEPSMPSSRRGASSLFSRVRELGGSAISFAPSFAPKAPTTTLHEFFNPGTSSPPKTQPLVMANSRRFSLRNMALTEPSWLRSDTPVFPSPRPKTSISISIPSPSANTMLFSHKVSSPTSSESSSSDTASSEDASSSSSCESPTELSKA